MPDLRTRPGVELARVGTYSLSTGEHTFTRTQLAAAVTNSEGTSAPRIKLGHVDPRFDGEPALGVVKNLRLADDGDLLIGDLVGIPGWLDDALDSAYPGRSIEAAVSDEDMRLTALALLGATRPGIDTLKDLELALAAAAPEDAHTVVYVAASLGAMTATDRELRPAGAQKEAEAPARPENNTQKESVMDPKDLRVRLGLAEDASDEDVTAKLDEFAARPTEDDVTTLVEEQVAAARAEEAGKIAASAEGTIRIDQATYDELKASADLGRKAHDKQQETERETYLAAAVQVGKFGRSRLEHYRDLYESDPEGARETIDALAEGLVPVAASGGTRPDHDADTGAITSTGWFPQLTQEG